MHPSDLAHLAMTCDTCASDKPSAAPTSFFRFLRTGRETRLALIGALLIAPGVIFHELLPFLGVQSELIDLASIAGLLIAGYPIAGSAWRALIAQRRVTINVLITLAAVGALAIGAYAEAGFVVVLFAIGEAMEGYAAARTRDAIRSLMSIAPSTATVLRRPVDCPSCEPEEQTVATQDIQVGDVLVVRPGERIPMDGRVLAGASYVDQSPITGESIPVHKQAGDEVFAGTLNGTGALEVEVSRQVEDTVLARIIHRVSEAQAHKAVAERLMDRFARYYTPAVVGLAGVLAIAPPLLFGAPFWPTPQDQGWLYRALALLVVSCPCALAISTPVAVISAIGNAARRGILIKGGAYLEALARITAIAFDKTGTLTKGEPSVARVRSVRCVDPAQTLCAPCCDLLAIAGALERRSEHPFARAVVAAAEAQGVSDDYPAAQQVRAIAGRGVIGQVDGREVVIGSHDYFDCSLPHDEAVCKELDALTATGLTPVLVGVDGAYAGYIALADTVREGCRSMIEALRRCGVRVTVMLTGDNANVARAVAEQAGIDEVQAGLLPDQKVAVVRALRDRYGAVAMVGDGINDAPALAAATVGIAVGSGSGQAIETADVVLMGDSLTKLPDALRLAQATMRTIRTNIALATGIKAGTMVLVLLGLSTMWLAVLADVGALLLVTLRGMRLSQYR
jgi:Cd2+/Zn2+-exporting ATPase